MSKQNIERFNTLKELAEHILSDECKNRDKETRFTFLITSNDALVQGSVTDMAAAICMLADSMLEDEDDMEDLKLSIALIKKGLDAILLKETLRILGVELKGDASDIGMLKVVGTLLGIEEDFVFEGFEDAFVKKT